MPLASDPAEMIRTLEAIRIGDIRGFSDETVLDVLKQINKAGYYIEEPRVYQASPGTGEQRRSGQQGMSPEEECWRDYLTCQAASVDVGKLLEYLKSHGRIEIPEQGTTAYYQFITSLI